MFFKPKFGLFIHEERVLIDKIYQFILVNAIDKLKQRSSLHEYIMNTPTEIQQWADGLRHSPSLLQKLCSPYTHCDVTTLDNTDELYISHYNIDHGGDQGLFERHYDGVLRGIADATFIRALVYVHANDNFKVHFLTSNKSRRFSTYDYGLLDFNREYHYVEGDYNESMDYQDSRILLKLNYLVCPNCSRAYVHFLVMLNRSIFVVVKTSMEYSKSPQTIFQCFIGFLCNLFRVANNQSVYCTGLLTIGLLYLLYRMFYLFHQTMYGIMHKMNKTIHKYIDE